jgi:hypothetical protein
LLQHASSKWFIYFSLKTFIPARRSIRKTDSTGLSLRIALTPPLRDFVRIPEHPAGHSDNIRPPKPVYPATLV